MDERTGLDGPCGDGPCETPVRDTLVDVLRLLSEGWALRLDAPHGMASMNIGNEAKGAVAYAIEKHLER